jgi:glycosyltransferase involved in cell wall biosynthesis
MATIKILYLIPALSGGGAERQLSYLAPELARMGHEVHIAFSKEGPHKPELPGVVLHQLKSRSNYDPYLFLQLFWIICRIKPDIVHTWLMQMDILGGVAARLCKTPWMFREPSSAMAYPSNWKYHLRVLIGSGARAVVSNSSGGDEYWKTYLPNDRRHLISNGLPVQQIDETLAAFPPGMAQQKVPIVLYVGRLSSDISATKNLRFFLEMLAIVQKEQKVLGVLCGEGPQRGELEAMGRVLGLEADLHFTGQLPSALVWALMKKASVFVSLSAYEGCPNTVMEAAACGCPLVLSDIPAHRSLLGDNAAFFVDPLKTIQTAEILIQVLRNESVTKKCASVAKQKSESWSIEAMAQKYEKVYWSIL